MGGGVQGAGRRKVLFLLGPTAVGKTGAGIELALKLGGEIISADSMQLYRGMDIGTAKPTREEQRGVPHHLLDSLDIQEGCDVALFRKMALDAMEKIHSRGKWLMVVGGTGMYVRALTRGLCEGPRSDPAIRKELESLGSEVLMDQLQKADPVAAGRIHAHDRQRMVRALEFYRVTGEPLSSFQKQWENEDSNGGMGEMAWMVGLQRDRADLYRRCDARVESMFQRGFVEEVQSLMKQGLEKAPTASRAIGYADVMEFLKKGGSLKETCEKVKQRTRQYAKRQLTWFRRENKLLWVDLGPESGDFEAARKIQEIIFKQDAA